MFPLHCNKCFRRHKLQPTLVFHVSRCGHIVCATCLQKTCPVCSQPFKGCIVSKEMPQGISDYFGDPLRLYHHFQKVIQFQYDQERRLAEHMCNINDQAEQILRHKQMDYKQIQQKLQTKLDQERHLIHKYREYIARHEKDGDQPRNMALPSTALVNARYQGRRAMSEPPAGSSLEKVLLRRNSEQIFQCEKPREQTCYMKPPIMGLTRPRYLAPKGTSNPVTIYNPHFNKSLQRPPYMTPPITTEPRPRYPHGKYISDSTNKPSSTSVNKLMPELGKRGVADISTIEVQGNKSRTLSPILPCENPKKNKPNVAWDSIKSV